VTSPTTGFPGYNTTLNNGGEYKVWVSTEPTFQNQNTKTDNFKVVSAGDPCGPLFATVNDDVICSTDGGTATLTAVVSGVDPAGTVSYSWSGPGFSAGNVNPINPTAAGLYVVTVTETISGVTPPCTFMASGSVTVLDCTGGGCPVECPPDTSVACGTSTDPSITGFAVCSGDCTSSYADSFAPGCQIQRTWTCKDNVTGLTSSCTQTITEADTTPPTIQCSDTTLECAPSLETTPAAVGWPTTSSDSCSSCINVTVYSTHTLTGGGAPYLNPAGSFTVPAVSFGDDTEVGGWHPYALADFGADLTGYLIAAADGTYSFTLHSDDGALLFIDGTLVVDHGGPQSPGDAAGSVFLTQATNLFEIQYFEAFGGPATLHLVVPDGVSYGACLSYSDVSTPGNCVSKVVNTITRTWTATDACGNQSQPCVQTITVKDTTKPTINCPAATTVSCANGVPAAATDYASFVHQGGSASDTCSGTPTVTCLGDAISNQTCANRYTITRTYQATDACGNTQTCTQTITVDDETAPVIFCPDNIGTCMATIYGTKLTISTPSASDNCGGTITPTGTRNDGKALTDWFPCRTTTITWTAADACGIAAQPCYQKVIITGATICVTKFYDANANPLDDATVITGWKVVLTGKDSALNSVGPLVMYTPNCFTEAAPSTTWVPTTATSLGVTVSDCVAYPVAFHDLCSKAPSGGYTIGFWGSSNGATILKAAANYPGWVTTLNSCSLRNANGSVYLVPTTSSTAAVSSLATWLQGANAVNMAYMLSAQLTAATLNVTASKTVSDSTILFVSKTLKTGANANVVQCLTGTTGFSVDPVTGDGFITVGALRAAAKASLAANGNTTASSATRNYQECLKDLLDQLNNNGNNGYNVPLTIVSGTPCAFTTPY
jgi:PA14 domain